MAALKRQISFSANGTDPLRHRYVPVTPRPEWVECVPPALGERTIYKNEDFIKLGLRVTSANRYVWLRCLKATAALYGWDKAFPTLIALKQQTTGSPFIQDMGRKGWKNSGGVRHTICRSPITQGTPKGFTNTFAVSGNATTKDIALIAQSTEVDWHWMTCRYGERRSREQWEATPTT